MLNGMTEREFFYATLPSEDSGLRIIASLAWHSVIGFAR